MAHFLGLYHGNCSLRYVRGILQSRMFGFRGLKGQFDVEKANFRELTAKIGYLTLPLARGGGLLGTRDPISIYSLKTAFQGPMKLFNLCYLYLGKFWTKIFWFFVQGIPGGHLVSMCISIERIRIMIKLHYHELTCSDFYEIWNVTLICRPTNTAKISSRKYV